MQRQWPLGLIVPIQDPTPFSVFSPQEWPESLSRARAASYSVVELAITDPVSLDPPELVSLVNQYELMVGAITTGQAAWKEGLSLSSPDETVREKAMNRLMAHAKLAQYLGAVVIIGLLRGKNGDFSLLYNSLKECVQAYPAVRFALEPLNRYETALINTVSEAISLLDRVGADNLGLLFDTFHANIEERSVREAVELCGDRLFHVHLADSNRWIPGFGHFPFAELWQTLAKIGYQGALVLECFPRPNPEYLLSEAKVRGNVGLF